MNIYFPSQFRIIWILLLLVFGITACGGTESQGSTPQSAIPTTTVYPYVCSNGVPMGGMSDRHDMENCSQCNAGYTLTRSANDVGASCATLRSNDNNPTQTLNTETTINAGNVSNYVITIANNVTGTLSYTMTQGSSQVVIREGITVVEEDVVRPVVNRKIPLLFVAHPHAFGMDTVTFTITNGKGYSLNVHIAITVVAVNNAPTANSVAIGTHEDTAVNITLSGGDIDGDALSYVITTPPRNGSLSGTAPNVTYTPHANYNGADAFAFVTNDGTVQSAPATITITVDATNDTPAANSAAIGTHEDTAVNITLSGDDVDGDALSYVITTSPRNGSLSGTAPNVTYTPHASYSGADTFVFVTNDGAVQSAPATITVTVRAINLINDYIILNQIVPINTTHQVVAAQDSTLYITLQAIDRKKTGLPVHWAIIDAPTIGNATLSTPIGLGHQVVFTYTAHSDTPLEQQAFLTASIGNNTLTFTINIALVVAAGDADNDGIPDAQDVDDDNNGMIELTDAQQINNMRLDLSGNSYASNRLGQSNTIPANCQQQKLCGYELTNNVNLSNFTHWKPIGWGRMKGYTFPYSAKFDGKNNQISNLRIQYSPFADKPVGLFASVSSASISNLTLVNPTVRGEDYTSALAGRATRSHLTQITLIGDGSSATIEVHGHGRDVGGLVGQLYHSTITFTSSMLTIRGGTDRTDHYVGGLIGNATYSVISHASVSASVIVGGGGTLLPGPSDIGGLIGNLWKSQISNSWSMGEIIVLSDSTDVSSVGGLIGSTYKGVVLNTWSRVNVRNKAHHSGNYGGLIGILWGLFDSPIVYNSWSGGIVESPFNADNYCYGGLIGYVYIRFPNKPNIPVVQNVWSASELRGAGNTNVGFGGLIGYINWWPLVSTSANTDANAVPGMAGRNYYNAINSSITAGIEVLASSRTLTQMAALEGGAGDDILAYTDWDAGVESETIQKHTQYCDTNANNVIDNNEIANTNRVWDFGTTNDIPIIRCTNNATLQRTL